MIVSEGPGALQALFTEFCKEMDGMNEKRERLVKASRDVTYQSKKVIFALHRTTASTLEETLRRADADLDRIAGMIGKRISLELRDVEEMLRFHRSISPGVQEYVEASLFLFYLRHETLQSHDSLQQRLAIGCANAGAPCLHLEHMDYLLGAADVCGELMRHAVAASARGEEKVVFTVRDFLSEFSTSVPMPRVTKSQISELEGKIRTLTQSLAKVERSCFDLCVRRAEFPHKVVRLREGPDDDHPDDAPAGRKKMRLS